MSIVSPESSFVHPVTQRNILLQGCCVSMKDKRIGNARTKRIESEKEEKYKRQVCGQYMKGSNEQSSQMCTATTKPLMHQLTRRSCVNNKETLSYTYTVCPMEDMDILLDFLYTLPQPSRKQNQIP